MFNHAVCIFTNNYKKLYKEKTTYRIYPAIHLFNIRNLFLFKVPYFGLATALSGLAVGMLYFYASFWLFAQTGTPLAIRIIAGVVFSVTIIAGVF
jgi:hypothetical protein